MEVIGVNGKSVIKYMSDLERECVILLFESNKLIEASELNEASEIKVIDLVCIGSSLNRNGVLHKRYLIKYYNLDSLCEAVTLIPESSINKLIEERRDYKLTQFGI